MYVIVSTHHKSFETNMAPTRWRGEWK